MISWDFMVILMGFHFNFSLEDSDVPVRHVLPEGSSWKIRKTNVDDW